MFPIVLDTKAVNFILIGNGPLATKRKKQLVEAGAQNIQTFTADPGPEALKQAHIVYVVDLPEKEAKSIAQSCRKLGVLVNVEDVPPLCDFHTPSQVRRGDLLFSISTAGKSPALARRLRQHLSKEFGPEWGHRLEKLAKKRQNWRNRGLDMKKVAANTEDYIDEKEWLA